MMDKLQSPIPAEFVVNTAGWARAPEVIAYATRRGITLSDAIRELVNSGLSNL